jgi:DNA repair protein RadC
MSEETQEYVRAIKNLAVEDRPREKAHLRGFESLTDAELLAILVGSGTTGESVVDMCQRVLQQSSDKLYLLARRSVADLMKIKGIGEAKATTILAAMELGKRFAKEPFDFTQQVRDPATAYDYVKWDLANLDHEEFWIITLDQSKHVTGKYPISRGGTTATVVEVKMLLRVAIEHQAVGIIAVHNHPSSNMRPSSADDLLTSHIREGCSAVGIDFVDHIIVGKSGYYSYMDSGKI